MYMCIYKRNESVRSTINICSWPARNNRVCERKTYVTKYRFTNLPTKTNTYA